MSMILKIDFYLYNIEKMEKNMDVVIIMIITIFKFNKSGYRKIHTNGVSLNV